MINKVQKGLEGYIPKPLGSQQAYAVFLPLLCLDGVWQVLYQVRSETVSQPGEVSFPGGRVESGETAAEAAVREVVEELGVTSQQVSLWGELDYQVFAGGHVHCFVGQLQASDLADFCPNAEVASLFILPLSTLLSAEPTYYLLESSISAASDFPFERVRGGRNYPFTHHKREVPFYEGLSQTIWGMTAQFTHRFTQLAREWLAD